MHTPMSLGEAMHTQVSLESTLQSPLGMGNTIETQAYVESTMRSPLALGDTMQPPLGMRNTIETQAYVGDAIETQAYVGDAIETQAYVGDAIETQACVGDAIETQAYVGDAIETQAYVGNTTQTQAYVGNPTQPLRAAPVLVPRVRAHAHAHARPSARPLPQRKTVSAASIYTLASARQTRQATKTISAGAAISADSSPIRTVHSTPLLLDTAPNKPLLDTARSAELHGSPGPSPGLGRPLYPNGPLLVVPPSIYLYSEPSVQEAEQYDTVVNCALEAPSLQKKLPHAHYVHVPWTHESPISADLPRLTSLLRRAVESGDKVLVHCECGVSRSASLVVAYMMRYGGRSFQEAYGRLRKVAGGVSPNLGLVAELHQWERALMMDRGIGQGHT